VVLYGTSQLKRREDAYLLLATAVREVWALNPLPEIQRQKGGKPYFPSEPGREFNFSHSGTLCLCALDDRPVGADIQVLRNTRPGLLQRVCSPEELDWLEAQPDAQRAFAALWTLKECLVKQSGVGLTRNIQSLPIPIPQNGAGLYRREGLWFRTYAGENWMAAVCGEAEPPEEILWREAT
jgi:4'-phosphopantetheinyl transferase